RGASRRGRRRRAGAPGRDREASLADEPKIPPDGPNDKSDAPSLRRPVAPPPIRVLAAVIRRDGRYLICRRPAHKRHGGLWELPGGKLDPGESLLDAARREMWEELALEATAVGRALAAIRDPGSPFLIEFVEVEIADGAMPEALEHEEVRWVAPVDLGVMDLAPSDRAFVAGWVGVTPP